MTAEVRDLLVSLNIPSNTYQAILTEFDDTFAYLNDILISMSREGERSKSLIYVVRNKLEVKKSVVESLELQLRTVTIDRDSVRADNLLLVKQRNIYCNSAKRLYAKWTEMHHSSEICKEQHRKLLPFLAFKREKIDETSYDCEKNI